jgi:hypothetical protein
MDHERAFAHGFGHADLIDFLLGAAAQVMGVGAAGDGDHRRLSVHGIGETGYRVGESRGGVHADAGPLGDAAPRVGHMDGGLLMPGVEDAEVLIRHHVQDRQDVIAGEGEDVFHAFEFEGFADQVTSCDFCHRRLLLTWNCS